MPEQEPLGLRLSNDRIPVHLGEVLLGYARFRTDGHLQMINAPDDEERARSQAALANRGWIEEKAEAPAAEQQERSGPLTAQLTALVVHQELDGRIPIHLAPGVVGYALLRPDAQLQLEQPDPELPAPPFGGRPAYERVFDALRNVELVDPTRLEYAVSAVMEALFGDRNSADQRFPRIELPWPRGPEQFEELLMRIPLWSMVAHLVRDRDAEVQHREYLGMMFLADDRLPPLLDHLDRMLRDSRELWRVCVDQEKMLARIGEALDGPDPVAAVRAILEAGCG